MLVFVLYFSMICLMKRYLWGSLVVFLFSNFILSHVFAMHPQMWEETNMHISSFGCHGSADGERIPQSVCLDQLTTVQSVGMFVLCMLLLVACICFVYMSVSDEIYRELFLYTHYPGSWYDKFLKNFIGITKISN